MSVNYVTVGELIATLQEYPHNTPVIIPRPYTFKMGETGKDVNEWDGPEHFRVVPMTETWDVFIDTPDPTESATYPGCLKLSPTPLDKWVPNE